jgi:hypothetical protein
MMAAASAEPRQPAVMNEATVQDTASDALA